MSNSGQAAKPGTRHERGIPPKAGCTANSLPGFKTERFETVTFFPCRKVERCQEGGALCILCNILLYCIFCRFSSRFFYCLNADVFARFRRFFGGAGGRIAAQAVERRAVPFWLFPVRGAAGPFAA